ncbi:DNA-binding response OmpR family regulator [Nocardioides aromaticivorans]|uniref:DNA-binding response OmpR family regulator n=1 Tax=Nocardioides aromaticivorans TaxID=200618 RepID=A0A7Y9ZFU8_9ACTN|nr:response regulator transcription factor [Nocardioides aromaticivorans]NYI44674.1 DNA-binding response OmpR family regulator [Nocardioides aromaticivorans]
MPVRLLIVEDDDAIAAPLLRAVQREGYDVERVAAGHAAIDAVAAGGVDLVLLDLGLPDMDGLDVCRQLRSQGYEGGIVILTARAGELDRVVGLDVGADDYLAKPFSLSELLARVRALLRRSHRPAVVEAAPEVAPAAAPSAAGPAAPAVPDFRLDRAARRVWAGDEELALTAKEFDVLALLEQHRGAVVSRETLMAEVWDENWFGSTKTLDATIGRLRQKLQDSDAPIALGTVRGVGFRLEDTPRDA